MASDPWYTASITFQGSYCERRRERLRKELSGGRLARRLLGALCKILRKRNGWVTTCSMRLLWYQMWGGHVIDNPETICRARSVRSIRPPLQVHHIFSSLGLHNADAETTGLHNHSGLGSFVAEAWKALLHNDKKNHPYIRPNICPMVDSYPYTMAGTTC